MGKDEVFVSICCITFNHELYIRQCLDGFLMQKANFKFEILIHDDASTDDTANIIREYENKYPTIIKPIYQSENQFSKGGSVNAKFQYPRANCKYVALCEGDDYWTDPLKLQKQVDFLEENEDHCMVYTKVKYFFQSKNKFSKDSWGGRATSFDQLITNNTVATLTTVFRTDLLKAYIYEIRPELYDWKMGDYPIWLYFSLKSKIYFMNEVTAVYRVLSESASHSTDIKKREIFINSFYDIKRFFLKYAKIRYNEQEFNDSLLSSLGSNAIKMKDLNVAKEHFEGIKKVTIKNTMKKIIPKYRILSFLYRLKKT